LSKLAAIAAYLRRLLWSPAQSPPGEIAESPPQRQLREQLFRCALQILDDGAGAEQVVRQALRQAEQGCSELGGVPRTGETESDWLLRHVISLSVQRLKALSIVPVLPPLPEAVRGAMDADSAPQAAITEADRAAATLTRSEGQRRERTTRALLKLPVEMRVTLILVLMQRRSLSEVASLLGSSETTCAFWLSHGRKQLRRALQRDLAPGAESGGLRQVLVSPETSYDLRGNKKAIARA